MGLEVAAISTIASFVSTAVGAYSEIQKGDTQAAMLRAEADRKEAKGRADLADSTYQASEQDRKTRELLGSATAQMGASGGIDPTYQVQGDITKRGNQNNRVTMWNGWQKYNQAQDEATVKRSAAESAESAGELGALSAGLKGLGGFAKSMPASSGGSTVYGNGGSGGGSYGGSATSGTWAYGSSTPSWG